MLINRLRQFTTLLRHVARTTFLKTPRHTIVGFFRTMPQTELHQQKPTVEPPPVSSSKKPEIQKNMPLIQKHMEPVKIRVPKAYFDFEGHLAYTHHNGKRLEPQACFMTEPSKGPKSPLNVTFRAGDETIISHLPGIWPGALDSGGKPIQQPRAPLVRKWKPIIKATREQQSWDDSKRPNSMLTAPGVRLDSV